MTHVPYPGCYCADCVEGTPSARITGDKDRSVQSRAPNQRVIVLTEANRALAAQVAELRRALAYAQGQQVSLMCERTEAGRAMHRIADAEYANHLSGNENFERLQSIARDGLAKEPHP